MPEAEHEPRVEERRKAVETFRLQVDAGRLRVDTNPEEPAPVSPAEIPAVVVAQGGAGPVARRRVRKPTRGRLSSRQQAQVARQTSGKPAPRHRRPLRSSSWLTSTVLHAVLFVVLSLLTFRTVGPPMFSFVFSEPAPEVLDELVEVDYTPAAADADQDAALDDLASLADLQDLGASLSADAAELDDLLPADLTEQAAPRVTPVGDFAAETASLFGEGMAGLADLGGPRAGRGGGRGGRGRSSGAGFFGVPVQQSRVVFLLDNSGSMRNGELETVIAELLACVDQLSSGQEFFVFFFSDAVYPMFYPESEAEYQRPTQETKTRLREWLATVEFCMGNMSHEAIKIAASMDPDVVFLLSDGNLRTAGGRKYNILLDSTGRDFVVHTIGMDVAKPDFRQQLVAIAEAHGGTYREASVGQGMHELAWSNPRPYRAEPGQGRVWGKMVQGWHR